MSPAVAAPRVAFYLLGEQGEDARFGYACRLIEKAYQQDYRVVARVGTAEQARALDELLWRFSDRSFVPHEVATAGGQATAPVVIVAADAPAVAADLLVNMGVDVPGWYEQTGRVAEILDAGEDCRAAGRERFRFYRERGVEPETHDLGAA